MDKRVGISQIIISFAIALITICLLFVLFSSLGVSAKSYTEIAKDGRLDLSSWDFEDDGSVRLDGDWEFYWDQIIMPGEFDGNTAKLTGSYRVPVFWTKYKDLDLPSKGDATYRLIIDTDVQEDMLAISIPELFTEYALYINGQLLVGNGSLGGTAIRYLDPDAFMFEAAGNQIEIVLQMHNHTHVNAGIGQSLILGTTDHIFWRNGVETALDLILVGICLFAGIYHLILFINRRKEYKLLCFTIFCVAVAVRGFISNTNYIMELNPNLPFLIGSRLITETIPILTVSMLLYVYFLFRGYIPKLPVQVLAAVSGLYMFIIAFADPPIYTALFIWYLIVPLAVCLIGLYTSILAIRIRSREAVLYLMGTLFLVAGSVNDMLVYIQWIDTGYRLGVGLAAFAVIQSFNMAMQYSRFEDERKQLYNKLHETDLAFMQAQIKPHFIYNALSAISHMIGSEPKKAKELLLDFSDYLRGTFDFANTSGLTTLAKEMEVVKAYVAIEKARFQERIHVEYEIEQNPYVLIPMLCIQPIVENAVRHGIMARAEGGTVKIRVWDEKGDTHVLVEDNGVGMAEDQIEDILSGDTSSNGLMNINGRLKLKFGTELKITNREEGGILVKFIIPGNPKAIRDR